MKLKGLLVNGAWCSVLLAALVAVGLGAQQPVAAQTGKGDPGTLRAAALLFRHGVISPKYSPPKVAMDWPMGYEQLTAIGMRQMYDQGQALRRKYVEELGLIDGNFKNSEVYVRSSNADRALQSAQLLLLGLFPLGSGPDPAQYDKTLEAAPAAGMAFNPVPIHSVALDEDAVMRPWTGKANCTRYRDYVKSLPKTQLYAEQGEKYRDFLVRVSSATGVAEGEPVAKILYEVNEIYEPLSALVQHKMPLPEGISEKDMELLSDLADWNYHHQFLGPAVGRLTGGNFVGEVIRDFAEVIKGGQEARKLYLYSGHQRTILGVEAALGIETARTEGALFHGRVPQLTAYYALELHEPTSGNYAVQLSYASDAGEQAIEIPECGAKMCSFERFVGLMSKVVSPNWRQDCG